MPIEGGRVAWGGGGGAFGTLLGMVAMARFRMACVI